MRLQLLISVVTIVFLFGVGIYSGYKRDIVAIGWLGIMSWSFLFGYATGAAILLGKVIKETGVW